MKKELALQAILKEWMRLPVSERQSENNAADFAMRLIKLSPDLTTFRCNGDRYQVIKGFLSQYLMRHDNG